ncbi:MAG: tyrosine-type recombinase/integrase [Gammaproteobacteria bacterium]
MSLTDRTCKSAPARDKPYKLSERGMFLLVLPNGGKYWRYQYRFGGKQKLLSLGVYPEVSLKEARESRDQARKHLAADIDPGEVRKEGKRQALVRSANAFEALAREWHQKRCGNWKPKHATQVIRSLELEVFPVLGARPAAEISPLELLETLRRVEARGALETAARVLQRCSAVFRYGIIIERCAYNPAADLKGALKTLKFENYKALPASELPEFLRRRPYSNQARLEVAIAYLRAHDGAASGRVAWRIPANRMKMGEAHLVPLSCQAVTTIEQLRLLNGTGRFVFRNQHNHEKYMSENTMLYALYRMGYHSRGTGHGFRTTASTVLNEMGFKPDVIERQLAHRPRDKVRAAYNKAEYLPERRQMMQHWADYLDGLRGGNVIPLRHEQH